MKTQTEINARQLGFFLAFFLPVGKLLELPSLLAGKVGGDLLLPAFLGLGLELLALAAVFLFNKYAGLGVFAFLDKKNAGLGKAARFVYSALLLLYAFPFLLDLEKFSHAAFSDTEPTFFSFLPFFVLCGFIATKGLKAVGRSADLCPALFFLPFLALAVLSIGSADFSNLLPLVEKPFLSHLKATLETSPFWTSGLLFLPLFEGYSHREGDGKKLFLSYAVGATIVLLFLAVFYGLYGPIAGKEHYALSKIGLFFPALATLGRTDLLLVYLITVVLFFFTALPVQLAVDLFAKGLSIEQKTLPAVGVNVLLFVAVLFLNRRYNGVYSFFTKTLSPVFFFFGTLLPVLALLLLLLNRQDRGQVRVERRKKEKKYAR